jgi:hypothetical protein
MSARTSSKPRRNSRTFSVLVPDAAAIRSWRTRATDIGWPAHGLVDNRQHGPRESALAQRRSAQHSSGAMVPKRSLPPAPHLLHPLRQAILVRDGECGPLLISRRAGSSPPTRTPSSPRCGSSRCPGALMRRKGRCHVTASYGPIGRTSGGAPTHLSPALPGPFRPPAPRRSTRQRRGRGLPERPFGVRGGAAAAASHPLGGDAGSCSLGVGRPAAAACPCRPLRPGGRALAARLPPGTTPE